MAWTTRRKFLGIAAGGIAGAAALITTKSLLTNGAPATVKRVGRSTVTITRGPDRPDSKRIGEILDRSICVMTGEKNPVDGWRLLFKNNEVVGIKVNTLSGRRLSSSPLIAQQMGQKLINAGLKPENIIIWDRTNTELQQAGYELSRGPDIKCFGTDDLPYGGYGSNIEFAGEVGSLFSRIVESCDALINIPILKDHDISGLSLGMKNWYGSIHNPNKYHSDRCTPYVADLSTHPYIKNKQRLIIVDALTVQPHGGPAYKPQWAVEYNGILMSTDPVAIDRTGQLILDDLRKNKGLRTLKDDGRFPDYLPLAEKYGLGNFDTSRIDKIEVL